jgi:cytochrome b
LGFAISYISGESDEFMNLHFAFGMFIGTFIILRLLFGLIGPRYSHFRDFPISLNNQREFLRTFFSKTRKYIGHNPPASLVMLAILVTGLLCSLSGYLMYAEKNHVFILINNGEILSDTHEVLANIFLGLVILHLTGILADTLFHSEAGTLASIFTGYKKLESENNKLTTFQKAFSVLWIIIPLIMFWMGLRLPAITSQENNGYKIENAATSDHDDD